MNAQNSSAEQILQYIKESNRLERLLVDNADEALFFYSLEEKLLYVNPAFEEITGYTSQELYEENFIAYVHPDDQERTMKLWEGLFRGEFFENIEYRIIKKDGELRWNSSSWKIVLSDDGEQIGIQGKQRDITARKQAEVERDELVISLQNALDEIQTLKGILPICSYCYAIRGDEGLWSSLEKYITNHSDAQFSHGICPECFESQLSELD